MNEYELIKQCKHAIGGKINEIGETLLFCELTDNLENVTLGECIDNCESQECLEVCRKDVVKCKFWDTSKCKLHH